jgi:acetyltransferase-like isoleucine patch superfamily enzyme
MKLALLVYKIINSNEYRSLRDGNKICSFKFLGTNARLPDVRIIKNPQYISIGNNFSALTNLRLEAWDVYKEQKFTPEITIGNNVCFNTDVHIGCINKVVIGNNVLLASRIYISDHSHGDISFEALKLPPLSRPLVSRGAVIIEDNVWIGEGVCILPGVTIGKNSIVGANSVVTKSFPANCVIAGIPGKIIKLLEP